MSYTKLCKDCEFFKIKEMPFKVGGYPYDFGHAVCEKHNLITDFVTMSKFDYLSCVEGERNGEL